MKKILLFLPLIAFVFSSCQNEKEDNSGKDELELLKQELIAAGMPAKDLVLEEGGDQALAEYNSLEEARNSPEFQYLLVNIPQQRFTSALFALDEAFEGALAGKDGGSQELDEIRQGFLDISAKYSDPSETIYGEPEWYQAIHDHYRKWAAELGVPQRLSSELSEAKDQVLLKLEEPGFPEKLQQLEKALAAKANRQ